MTSRQRLTDVTGALASTDNAVPASAMLAAKERLEQEASTSTPVAARTSLRLSDRRTASPTFTTTTAASATIKTRSSGRAKRTITDFFGRSTGATAGAGAGAASKATSAAKRQQREYAAADSAAIASMTESSNATTPLPFIECPACYRRMATAQYSQQAIEQHIDACLQSMSGEVTMPSNAFTIMTMAATTTTETPNAAVVDLDDDDDHVYEVASSALTTTQPRPSLTDTPASIAPPPLARRTIVGDRYTVFGAAREDHGECAICFEEYGENEAVALMNCLCRYHKQCLDGWFKKRQCCPVHKDF